MMKINLARRLGQPAAPQEQRRRRRNVPTPSSTPDGTRAISAFNPLSSVKPKTSEKDPRAAPASWHAGVAHIMAADGVDMHAFKI